MKTVYLVRHGRSTANDKGLLAGRAPFVSLDQVGKAQAMALGEIFSQKKLDKLVSSPLERCLDTAKHIKAKQKKNVNIEISKDFLECDYGSWTNKKIVKLAALPLWKTVQEAPSQVTFPNGEGLLQMATRASSGLINLLSKSGKRDSRFLVVTHADIIKALIAHALGMHLDQFQKLIVDPASISTLKFNDNKLFVSGVNDTAHLKNIDNKTQAPSGAVLGGGAG